MDGLFNESGQVLFAFSAIYFMMDHPLAAVYCYGMCSFLSSIQKMFGRGEEKPRRTNAIAFIGLLMVLGHFYPWCMFWFQLVVIVEVASVLPPFRSPVSQQANPLLAILSNRFLLIFIACGAELFYLFLYLDVFYEGPSLLDLPLLSILTAATFPAALLYSLSSFIRLIPLIKSYPSSVKNDEKKQ